MTLIRRFLVLFCITLTFAAQHTRASQPPNESCSWSNFSCGAPNFTLGRSIIKSNVSEYLKNIRYFANMSRTSAESFLQQYRGWNRLGRPTCLLGAQRNHSQDLMRNRTDALGDLMFFNNFLGSIESYQRIYGANALSLFRNFTASQSIKKLLCQVKLALDNTVHNVSFTYNHTCACSNRTMSDFEKRNFAYYLVERMKVVFDFLCNWN